MQHIDDSEEFYVEYADESGAQEGPAPQRSIAERFLSPQSLQRMMASGGALLVLGMIAWLWSIGLFSNPIVVAAIIGGASLTAIAAGVTLVKLTRHELAGQGLALLGSLALPLNLWFYDAQGLITLADGGHLWIPAALCCGIYAAVAWILRDARFVYAFVGGIVLTGMLFLADRTINQFWSLMPQVTFLVSAGWVCAFASRQFPIGDSDFSRQRFGRAFLRSGMGVMAAGLLLLAGAQLTGIAGDAFGFLDLPRLATDHGHKMWAFGILLASTAGFAIEHVTRSSDGRYGIASAGLGLWSGVSLLDALNVHPTLSHLAILAGIITIVVNGIRIIRTQRQHNSEADSANAMKQLSDACVPMSVVLVMIAAVHFLGQFVVGSGSVLFSPTGWTLVTQLLTTTAAAWTTAVALRKDLQQTEMKQQLVSLLSFAGAVAVTLAAWTLCLQLELRTVIPFATAALAAPIAAAAATVISHDTSAKRPLRIAAGTSLSCALILIAVFTVFGLFAVAPSHLILSGISIAAAAVCFLCAAGRGDAENSVTGFIAVSCAVWQAGSAAGLDTNYALALAPTLTGIVLAGVRYLSRKAIREAGTTVPEDAQNTLVILGNLAGWLLAMNRVLVGEETVGLLVMLAVQLFGTVAVGLAARATEWRYAFRVATGALMLAVVLVTNGLTSLTILNRLELGSLAAGITLLTLGTVAWYRETDRPDGMATAGFSIGSLLTVIPLSIGLVFHRIDGTGFVGWGMFHEVSVIVFGLLLLALGLLGRIRSTTIAGTTLLTVFIGSLVTLIRLPDVLQSVSVMMMIGGATFFGTAVLLSIYRDHLLALPGKIREGHGIFQVLKWR